MPSRRDVLKVISVGLAAAASTGSSVKETEDIDECRGKASQLAASMKARHGGEWKVCIDRDFVLISQTSVSPLRQEPLAPV